MNAVRYEALRTLQHAAVYLADKYPGARNPLPQRQEDREARVACKILIALEELVTWCDLATL